MSRSGARADDVNERDAPSSLVHTPTSWPHPPTSWPRPHVKSGTQSEAQRKRKRKGKRAPQRHGWLKRGFKGAAQREICVAKSMLLKFYFAKLYFFPQWLTFLLQYFFLLAKKHFFSQYSIFICKTFFFICKTYIFFAKHCFILQIYKALFWLHTKRETRETTQRCDPAVLTQQLEN